jgi:uncharacterized protein
MGVVMGIVRQPWPWYVAGPLIGLFLPVLLLIGNRLFGISSNLRHLCAAVLPGRVGYFQYDWKGEGVWNLSFIAGVTVGGFIAVHLLGMPDVAISPATREALAGLGVRDFSGLVPRDIFTWASLSSVKGAVLIIGGGFLVGFGTAYAGGCTSGHAIAGLADLQLPSLIAVVGFFAGGLLATYWILPWLL